MLLRRCLVLLRLRSLTLLLRRRSLPLLLRRGLTLLLRRCCLPLLLRRRSLPLLLLRRSLPLLLRSFLPLLLRRSLALLLWSLPLLGRLRLSLLLLRRCLPLLLDLLPLLLRRSLPLRLLLLRLPLLLRNLLPLLLRRSLPLLLLLHRPLLLLLRLPLLRLRLTRMLLRFLCLPLLLLRNRPLLQLRRCRMLLLLCLSLIAHLYCRGHSHIAIGCERLVHDHACRPSMVHIGKLCAVGAGNMLIPHLRLHWRGVLLMASCQFSGACTHLQSSRSTVEAHADSAAVALAYGAVIHVMHYRHVYIVHRAVVVEVPAAPVSALVAEADVAKPVIHAAIVANVRSPVAPVEPVAMVRVAPVARRPKRALVRSLNPPARNPVVARVTPCPVAGSPQIAVPRILGLIVFGQRRWRLRGIGHRLNSVPRIVRILPV